MNQRVSQLIFLKLNINMKKVVCWKVLKLNATFDEALKMYINQDYDHPVSINCQSSGKIFYPEEKIKLNQLQIS